MGAVRIAAAPLHQLRGETMIVLLIDLSGIAHPIWHVSGKETDPDFVSNSTVKAVREISSRWPGARCLVCCDAKSNWRKELAPSYKANRDAKPEALRYQIWLAKDRLAKEDGLLVLECEGFEADDIIASATRILSGVEDVEEIIIASTDKDLCQLVADGDVDGREPSVRLLNLTSKEIYGPQKVVEKFGVTPGKIGDYLAIVGDAADNVVGAKGIGPVKACALLRLFGNLAGIFSNVEMHSTPEQWSSLFPDPAVKKLIGGPAVLESLRTGGATVALARKLVELRTDALPDFSPEALLRAPTTDDAVEGEEVFPDDDAGAGPLLKFVEQSGAHGQPQPATPVVPPSSPAPAPAPAAPSRPVAQVAAPPESAAPPSAQDAPSAPAPPAMPDALAVYEPHAWQLALEPRSPQQAIAMAHKLHHSTLFASYGNHDAILAVILAGRARGLDAVTALQGMHIIEGRLQVSSSLMVGLCMRSKLCRYFRVVESTPERSTYETLRVDHPEPVRYTYTIEMARQAELTGPTKSGKASNWMKRPATMLRHRCESELARMVYPDVVSNCYDSDEIEEIQASRGT